MYHLMQKWKILSTSNMKIESKWYETIQKDFSQEELEKLNSWYLYIDWEIVEWPEIKNFEKQKLFSEYKTNLGTIKQLNAEIQEVEATAEYFPDIAEKRIDKLTKDRTELRTKNGWLIQEAVSKFGEEIISEF
jgi:wobble nucleotide-excising tRNase